MANAEAQTCLAAHLKHLMKRCHQGETKEPEVTRVLLTSYPTNQ